jgi:hypothetical protein
VAFFIECGLENALGFRLLPGAESFYRGQKMALMISRIRPFPTDSFLISEQGSKIMPYNAASAVAFAQNQTGRYRDGECWTLIEDAVTGAGGRSSRVLTPNFGPTSSYVWGTVVQVSGLQAGDVLQFANYSWTRSITVEVSNPDGSGSTDTSDTTQDRGTPQHSAMVVRVVSSGIVDVVEQNIPRGSGPVQTFRLVLVAPAPATTTTREPSGDGHIVTVTTTTDRVVNPPRCYRPINA